MKKTLIALSALAATAAFAQSSTTLYGVADAYFGSEKASPSFTNLNPVRQTVVNDGGLSQSRLGVSVKEDLGNGLSAFAVIEGGIALDAGAGGLGAGRKSVVGLSGNWGTFSLGAQQTPLQDVAEGIVDAQNNSSFSALNTALRGNVRNAQVNNMIYTDSARYDTPSFNGFSASGQASNSRYSLNLKYENGPLGLGLAYQNDRNTNALLANALPPTPVIGHFKTTVLGGYYDFGMAKLHLGYGRVSTTLNNGVLIPSNRELSVGVAVPVDAFTFVAQYARVTANNRAGSRRAFGLEGRYALSKRSTVYAGYDDMRHTINTPTAIKSNRFGVGMRHVF